MARNTYANQSTTSAGDLFVFWRPSAGTWYTAAIDTMVTYIKTKITTGINYTTQYAAPSASPFTVTVTAQTTDIWLVLTPSGTLANGTITLPAPGSSYDKQQISVNSTQAVTSLTVDGNGATAVTGEPSGMAANDFFTLRYDATTSTWYRIA